MVITADLVKELREQTGVSVMQCKKALEEAGGDKEKALTLLRRRGAEIAAKKGDRALGAGVVASYVHSGSVGAMVVLRSETDFVAKNSEFATLARDIAMHAAAMNPLHISRTDAPEAPAAEILLEQPFIKDSSVTIGALIEGAIQKFGEKIAVEKLVRLSAK